MPTRRIQRGPAAGGQPAGFQNSPAFNELYVDGADDSVVVGTGVSGSTAAALAKRGQPGGAAVTFANLPAAPVAGMVYTVTDSTVNTWGTAIAGGGANTVLAFYNGAAWTVAAK